MCYNPLFANTGYVGYLYWEKDVQCLSVKELVSFPSMLLKPHQPSHYTEQRSTLIKRVLRLVGGSAKPLLIVLINVMVVVIFLAKLRTQVIRQELICEAVHLCPKPPAVP